MDWLTWVLIIAAVAGLFALKRLSLVSRKKTMELLAQGAKVVDVRTEREFAGGTVPGAINLPMSRVNDEALKRFPDRSQPLLLHCLSGGRSAVAKVMFRRMGYTQVFNLGSYARANKLVSSAKR